MSLRSLQRMDEAGVLVTPDECAGCKEEFVFGGWHIVHGLAHCANCGSIYNIKDGEDRDPGLAMSDGWLEAVQEFYEEHGERSDRSRKFESFVKEHYPELIEE